MPTRKIAARILQHPLQPQVTPPIVHPKPPADPAAGMRARARVAEAARQEAAASAELVSLPVQHAHAAGIDVGDASHWVCVDSTPDSSDRVREFPAHTPGLRQLVAWLRQCGVTTVALEASGERCVAVAEWGALDGARIEEFVLHHVGVAKEILDRLPVAIPKLVEPEPFMLAAE